jgi:Undecaprenyl-phosphate glucose phosphotransferase
MTRRITLYNFYLRLLIYLLPALAFAMAFYLIFTSGLRAHGSYSLHQYLRLVIVTSFVWSMAVEHGQLATVSELFEDYLCVRRVIIACVITYAITTFIIFFSRLGNYSRVFLAASAVLLLPATLLLRTGFRLWIIKRRHLGKASRILVVGADGFARRVASRLRHGPFASSTVVGHVKLPDQPVAVEQNRVYEIADLSNFSVAPPIDEIVIALPWSRFAEIPALRSELEALGVPIRLVLDFRNNIIVRDKLFQVGGLQILNLDSTQAESLAYMLAKRAFDIVFSCFCLLVTAPLMLAIAVAIRLSSPGPVLFTQERVGLNGRVFRMYKFRTMRVSSEREGDTVWTTNSDPRRTALGAFLRKTSLDELPQFFNVMRGDMSVVGPRPERPYFVQQFRRDYDRYSARHRLKVGITGWAQVNGYRGDTSIEKRVEYDLHYLRHWNLALDLKIIAMTVYAVLVSKNAY